MWHKRLTIILRKKKQTLAWCNDQYYMNIIKMCWNRLRYCYKKLRTICVFTMVNGQDKWFVMLV